jgi:ATP-dependent protease Clp ATPase subunit
MKMECSFCGASIAKPVKGGPSLVVAGPSVFICRDCVGLCIQIMAESDPDWRDQKIEALSSLRSRDR